MQAEYEAVGLQPYPVLLLWGQEDQIISSTDIQLVRTAIPRLDFHEVKEAGHLLHYERPGIVNPLLEEFLEQL